MTTGVSWRVACAATVSSGQFTSSHFGNLLDGGWRGGGLSLRGTIQVYIYVAGKTGGLDCADTFRRSFPLLILKYNLTFVRSSRSEKCFPRDRFLLCKFVFFEDIRRKVELQWKIVVFKLSNVN